MRDEERTNHVEDAEEKTSRPRKQLPRQDISMTSSYLLDEQAESAFSRELVVRLINWVKHI